MRLYEHQASWDDTRARQRADLLRSQVQGQLREDLRWLPLAMVLVAVALIGIAGVGPA